MTHIPEGKAIQDFPFQNLCAEYQSVNEHRAPRKRSRVPRCSLRESHVANYNVTDFPEWMDLRTTQAYVSVSDRTLRDWIHREHDPLPAVQDGGKIFISRSRLDRWMLSHPVTSESTRDIGEIVDDVMKSFAGVQ